ncbi:hypothetical protein [Photobacterium leiognathi]|uniref:hypothetical protein n=1 Tax=Photobacterium leiognathi TaxID=553611 RepID=UPI002981F9C3|nr:hypothetical protein [Photobacterium leiognathi]
MSEFDSSLQRRESCDSLFFEGAFADSIKMLDKLTTFIVDEDICISNHVTLIIDDDHVSINEFQDFVSSNPFPGEFQITIDTKNLIQEICSGNGDIDEYLFTTEKAFNDNLESLGVLSPLVEGDINKTSNTRIHVYGLKDGFGGPKLAIVPIENAIYGDSWLQGSNLPSAEVLLKQVHLITQDKVNLDPKNFELSWGNLKQEAAKKFKHAYAQHLLVALSSDYYSIEKVQFKGLKHIEANISSYPELNISNEWLETLSNSVKWVYGVEDPSVPLQLFVDRLSLEYSNGTLLAISNGIYSNCLEQAQNNYKYVIAKRSDDYRKELKDIYSDIKTVTDKFMDKSAALSSELLKSLLTIGFVFTVGTISKAIVNEKLLHSKEGLLLFKLIGIYLIISFFIRWLNASAELKIASNSLNSWSKKLHSHISTEEVNNLISQQTRWSRLFYLVSLSAVAYIQCALGLAAFYSQGVFWYLGV